MDRQHTSIMRTLEEIRKNERLIIGAWDPKAQTLTGWITVPMWQGTFVCGFDENGWEHVSVAPFDHRLPTWTDMCTVKDIFWQDEEACIQIHPKKSEYVNIKNNCLHIWRNKEVELPK